MQFIRCAEKMRVNQGDIMNIYQITRGKEIG